MSVLVLTLNEELNLERCLQSVQWSDDIVVFDSFSTDRTIEIAQKYGARIVQRKFDNWSAHQNWAVSNIPFKYPWVYYSDADEVVSDELAAEIEGVVTSNTPLVAFRVLRKEMLGGMWLRFSSMYPVWILRLFRPSNIRWERLVNPIAVVDGPTGQINEHIIHYSFNKGLFEWVQKHNAYAQFEAREAIASVRSGSTKLADLFAMRDPVRRRKAMKNFSFRLPFRPLLRFFYMYVLRMGFRDGWAGITYCKLVSMYEFMIDLNVREIRAAEEAGESP
ncbi:MAG TPA: glycosyltransferase family 2 protein [Tepidisphaeraceae bacterium]